MRFLALAFLMSACALPLLAGDARQAAFDDGWKWYEHRRKEKAPDSELSDILRTLIRKYDGTGIDLTLVRESLALHQGPSSGKPSPSADPAALQAAYNDGWKWYRHRKKAGAPDTELTDILRTMMRKYEGSSLDLERVRAALALHAPAVVEELPGVPAPRKKETAAAPPPPAAKPPEPKAPKPAAAKAAAPAAGTDDAVLEERIAGLSHANEDVRVRAARELGRLADPRAVGPLVKVLGDSSTFVSMVAANSLVKIGDQALPALTKAAGEGDAQVRISAIVALGDMKRKEAVPALKRALEDPEPRIRRAAEVALKKIESTAP